MKAIKFPEQNIVFTKPQGWTDEQCGSLPAYRGDGEMVSCWKFSLKERIKVLFKGVMWLGIHCNVQPPVYLTVTSPFVAPPQVETEG